MNRERLKYRKLLREMSWLLGGVGLVLVLYDWLVSRVLFPTGPWWLRIASGVVGLLMFWGATKIAAYAKSLGRRRRADVIGK